MKKTSKKLLSFFLAVVMVVTSCSVGLTAFAADKQKSNGYWSTDADIDSAFESLNELVDTYVPVLLNIPTIKALLEDKLKMEITDTTSISDVVAGASPILLPLLLGLAPDKGEIRDDWSKMADTYFAYLDDPNAAIDFYTLYQFCAENPDAEYKEGGKVVWSAKDVKEQLDNLLNAYKNARTKYEEDNNKFYDVFYVDLYDEVANNFVGESGDFYTGTKEEIENTMVFGTPFKDYENADADFSVKYVKKILAGVGSFATVDSIADAFYYLICESGQHELTTEIYLGLAIKAGAEITTESIGGSAEDVLTMENYKELIAKADPTINPYDFFVPVENWVGASDSPFFGDIALGYLAYYGVNVDSFKASNYITEEDINKFIEDTFTNKAIFKGRTESGTALVDIGDVQAYFESDSCAFNKNAANALAEFASSEYSQNFVEFLQTVYASDNAKENAKTMMQTSLNFGDFAFALSEKTFIDAINAIIPARYIYENVDDSQQSNIGFTIANIEFAYRELNAYKSFVEPQTAELKYTYKDFALPDDYIIELTNKALNEKINWVFSPDSGIPIQDIIDKLLETNVGKLEDLLQNIWSDLYKDPVSTIAKLLPVVAIVADELVMPIILNGEGDLFNGDQNILYQFLVKDEGTLLYQYSQAAGSDIGIGALDFDLNKALPAICHWLTGDKAYDYAGTVGYYSQEPYSTDVPKFLNIYIADKALYDIGNQGFPEFFRNLGAFADNQELATILGEVIESVINALGGAVEDYLADHANDVRKNKEGRETQSGINNIFVALPQIIDIAGKKFIQTYNIDSDWAYAYEGKITQSENGNYINNLLNDFKLLTTKKDPSLVLESILNILFGNVVNGVIDFANDFLTTDEGFFVDNFEPVLLLLNSLGGFGEQSIITDILDGFFETTRQSEYAFTFELDESTGFVGLKEKSMLFIFCNIQNVIKYITTITASTSSESSAAGSLKSSSENSPLRFKGSANTTTSTVYKDLLTQENIDVANSLIAVLDDLLSSLLNNSDINDFTIDKSGNLALGLASIITPEFVEVSEKYIRIVNGEEDYTSQNLSEFVVETYTVLENIVSTYMNPLDKNLGLLASAVKGAISPDSVGIRMSDEYSKTAKILLDNHRSWTEFTGEDLKFNFKSGDKKGFYKAFGESLSAVSAVVSILLSQIKDNNSKNYYELAVNPLLNILTKATGSKVDVMSVAEFNKASAADQTMNGLILPLFGIINGLIDAPATSLIQTLQGLAYYFEDSALKKALVDVVAPINKNGDKLVTGAYQILLKLSPTLAKKLEGVRVNIDIAKELNLPDKNCVVGFFNNLIGGIVTIKNIDWVNLSKVTAGEALLIVYGYAFDTIMDSKLIMDLLNTVDPMIVNIIKNLTPAQIFNILREVLESAQTPTEIYWTFKEYASKATGSFAYPTRITAKNANDAVAKLDGSVDAVFELLNSLGVTDIKGLSSLVNDKLYTNEILSTIAIALYSALEGVSIENVGTLATLLNKFDIDITTKGFANYLKDSSYGATFSAASSTIGSKSSWSSLVKTNKDGSKTYTTLDWGFKNGSAKAQTGFVNGLAAILRPFNDVLATLLAGKESFVISPELVQELISVIDNLSIETDIINLKNGVLQIFINIPDYKKSTITIEFGSIAKEFISSLTNKGINGGNGYENAVIPMLEAFMCKGVKNYSSYLGDYSKAKDSVLTDILTPVTALISDVCDAPFDTITKILPNVAYFLSNNGITQALCNLLGVDFSLLKSIDVENIIIPLVAKILNDKLGIRLPSFDFATIATHGTVQTVTSMARNSEGQFTTKQVIANQGEVLVAVLRYVADTLIKNTDAIKNILLNIDAIKKNATIKSIIVSILNQIKTANKDDIVRSVFYLLLNEGQDNFFDYSEFKYGENIFGWGELDKEFCETLPPMLDGLIGGLLEGNGGLMEIVGGAIYKDEIVAKLAKGLYGAIEGVTISPEIGSLTSLLSHFDIDFSTANVAALLTNKEYGEVYSSAASKIKSAGSWKNVKEASLSFGVTDRESFVNALCAVLRPLYGVLDVFLNDGYLNLANIASVPGSDCYTSTIVPLLEAFSCYNIKTQYQYREDMNKKYDSILIDIINPILDKVEDLLIAPVQTLTSMLPNLSLFFANDGLLQVLDNLLTPATALIEALHPIVDVNELLKVLNFNINSLLASTGLNLNINLDIYDIKGTLKPLIGAENVVTLLNKILGIIKIGGNSLGVVLPEIDWLRLASHGDIIKNGTSQAGTAGTRVYVIADSAEQEAETLIAVLRFVIDTVNYQDNYNAIVKLITGLLGDGVSDSISDTIGQVLGMLEGDSDTVIKDLVDLLQSLAG